MSFTVKRLASGLVAPMAPTPSGTLPLSVIDKVPGLRCLVRSLHVFANGGMHEPAEAIRQALAKALVLYYPLAGRLMEGGELEVECNGEGVWFIEAAASCSLQDLNYLDCPTSIDTDVLFPDSWPERDPADLLFLMQVTQFTCGGFVVGIQLTHTIADGLGAAQFITAVAELARGQTQPTIKPIWSREAIPNPPKLSLGPPPTFPSLSMKYLMMDISLDYITKLKNHYFEETAKRCSTFDVSIALIWQSRTRAIGFADGTNVHLCFMANTRQYLQDVLPPNGGYYGNCFYSVIVTASSEKIAKGSIIDVVKLIREAKAKLPVDFAKWAKGEFDEDPYELKFSYETLFASDWTHLGFNDVDYGWGKPVRVVPFSHASSIMPMCILGLPAVRKATGRLMLQCVEDEHLQVFQHELKKMAQPMGMKTLLASTDKFKSC